MVAALGVTAVFTSPASARSRPDDVLARSGHPPHGLQRILRVAESEPQIAGNRAGDDRGEMSRPGAAARHAACGPSGSEPESDVPNGFVPRFEFAMENPLPVFSIRVLMASEATSLYARLKDTGRLVAGDGGTAAMPSTSRISLAGVAPE